MHTVELRLSEPNSPIIRIIDSGLIEPLGFLHEKN